ncbi:MAG TPA: cobalamin-independent methionine synthase II family protein [Chloroflexota bacterium]|nr:cobalamin-independent methionine synthase II family protein [Chloroflexota bacterium]
MSHSSTARPIPQLLPTSVIGSHALPGWFWTALEAIKEGKYGQTDVREVMDDAVNAAVRDQERAGIDVITDGEMRRWYFVQGFYSRFTGLEALPPLRTQGVYGYDSPTRYRVVEKVTAPQGLGIVEEFTYLREQTERAIKMTCPGPLTLTIHLQARKGDAYDGDRLALANDVAEIVNRELHALADAGARLIQLDEPSYAVIPGQTSEWVGLYNRAVRGLREKGVRLGLHVCFGNLGSRPRGRRQYRWMFPSLLEATADQLVFEFANREMVELDLLAEVLKAGKDVGAGVVDVKSFYVEPAEEVAEKVRAALQYADPQRLTLVPDCGFFQLPRWLCVLKLKALVDGVQIVRKELEG